MPADPPAKGPRLSIAFLAVGSEMVSFTLFGLLIDWGLGTTPGFTIGLTILGLFAAFFHLTRMAKSMAAKNGPSGGTGTGAGGGA